MLNTNPFPVYLRRFEYDSVLEAYIGQRTRNFFLKMEFVTEKNVCGVDWCVCASGVEWETNPPYVTLPPSPWPAEKSAGRTWRFRLLSASR